MTMMMMKRGAQRGVSLLESVCAITIMGSVSAAALPKFVDLPGEARKAVVMGLEGALQSASTLNHMKCATQRSCDLYADDSALTLPDGTVRMSRGYPKGGLAQGIAQTLQLSGFTVVQVDSTTVFHKDGAPGLEGRCAVSYAAPTAAGGLPLISRDTTGC